MPISLSAKSSLRKSLKNRGKNVALKTRIRKVVKEFLAKPNAEGLKKVYSTLDKAVKNKIFHPNKVARLKSEYTRKVKTTKTEVIAKKKTAQKKMS